MPAVSIQNSEHYLWGDQCHGWHLLNDSRLHVIREMVPSGKAERRLLHASAQQSRRPHRSGRTGVRMTFKKDAPAVCLPSVKSGILSEGKEE